MCGQEYGKLGDHKWATAWGYTTSSGHAHVCTVEGCGAHDTVVKHTPGPEATESSAQKCTVCGFVIAPVKAHTHKMVKVDAVDETCTAEGKKQHYSCSVCGLISSDAKGTKEITDLKELVIPAAGHKESKWKSDADSHWKVCTVKNCGEVIEETRQEHEAGEDNKCAVCGRKLKNGAAAISKTPEAPSSEANKPESDAKPENTEADINTSAPAKNESNGVSMTTVIAVAIGTAAAAVGATLFVVKKKSVPNSGEDK